MEIYDYYQTASSNNRRIDESRFSKIAQYLIGFRDLGNGLAILTSENPDGVMSSRAENNERLRQLRSELEEKKRKNPKRFSYWVQRGFYGGFENSLIITNITLFEAQELAAEHGQHSLIWVQKEKLTGWVQYTMFRADGREMRSQAKIHFSGLKDVEDFFSQIGGGGPYAREVDKKNRIDGSDKMKLRPGNFKDTKTAPVKGGRGEVDRPEGRKYHIPFYSQDDFSVHPENEK